jgi:outer membrane protein assembly factor BamB
MRELRRRQVLGGLVAAAGSIGAAGCDARRAHAASRRTTAGTLLWRLRTGAGDLQFTLATADGMVYAKGSAPPVHAAVTYGIDAASGQVVWRTHRSAIDLVYAAGDGAVAGFAPGGKGQYTIAGLAAGTGKALWTYALGETTTLNDWWLRYADGLVFAQTSQPGLVAIEARTGRRVWSTGLTMPSLTGWLVIGEEAIYTSTGTGRLFALDAATGVPLWKVSTSPGLGALAYAGSVVCGLADGRAFAFDSAAGDRLWTTELGTGASYAVGPAAAGDTVFFIRNPADGDPFAVWALDASTGARAWTRRPARGQRLLALNTDSDSLYLGMSDGMLLALAAATGRTRWSQRLGAPVQRIVAAANAVYAADANGLVHAFST